MENKFTEEWRIIPRFMEAYEVSNAGSVRSLPREVSFSHKGRIGSLSFPKEKILTPILSKHGYFFVNLSRGGIRKRAKIHQLVAQAFIPNPENKRYINHINGIKTDNRANNLEWCTSSENSLHAFSIGLRRVEKGRNNKQSIPISQFNLDGTLVKDWESMGEVRRLTGLSIGNISACIHGKQKTAYGYIWKLKEMHRPTPPGNAPNVRIKAVVEWE